MSNQEQSSKERGQLTRRQFMGHTAVAAAVTAGTTTIARAQETGPNSRLGVGVIGCGGRGHGHMNTLKWIADHDKTIEIVAVCDAYRPRMQEAANAYGAKGYMDHRELLADPKVDIVTIATPDRLHGYQAIDAVRAGKHVYCEKPVTHWQQFGVVKQLAEDVKKSGQVFLLGTQGMSDGAWHKMRALVEDGLIGRPIHAECGYFRVGDWGERGMPIPDPNAKPGDDLDWDAFLADAPKRDFDISRFFRWRMYEEYAGGPSTDLFPHSLTPVASILNISMPRSVVAVGGMYRYHEREVPDTFNMLIDYPEEFTIAVLGTQGNNFQGGGGARGAGGRVPTIRGWEGTLTLSANGKEIVFYPAEESKKKEQAFPIEYGEDMVEYFRHFIKCSIDGNTDTHSPADLAYRTQTALIMGMLALKEGKTARFDTEKQEIVI